MAPDNVCLFFCTATLKCQFVTREKVEEVKRWYFLYFLRCDCDEQHLIELNSCGARCRGAWPRVTTPPLPGLCSTAPERGPPPARPSRQTAQYAHSPRALNPERVAHTFTGK